MNLKQEYNRREYLKLFQDILLPEDFAIYEETIEFEKQSKFKKITKIGEVSSLELNVYEILHESENDPRVALSKDSFRLMSDYNVRRALIIFISENSKNYRLSLVTIELKYAEGIADKQGKRVKKEYSNPRRYSFFLGPDSKTHTPEEYLIKKGRIKNFDDLIKRFSIEVVTEEFFAELSNWYFWALKNVAFPKDAENEKNGKNVAVIRLITRLIFIWFMKQKGLIPEYLFNEKQIESILNNLSSKESTYYKAILQNLFFATLNTPVKDRKFREYNRKQTGFNEDFMDHSYYRYEQYFKNPKGILSLFKDIPFLNGGLFECLDERIKENEVNKDIRIDGFSDRKDNPVYIPNFLFFSEEKEVDLNKDYGTKNKKYKVRGVINLLQLYNFTIDESTPVDIEIALDPELLGRVFENLLASYNPETETTAREATGSYYTPREIVDYMVTQSLEEYFKTHLVNVSNIDDKINNLLSYDNEENPFNDKETNTLINLINELKIIDPAVGSGAFPMGILQKLVLVLSKLDLHNEQWKKQQIEAVEKNVVDNVLKNDLIEKIESNFQKNELDYGRKLYLLQNCIYGVDIQPIAIQIAKLRFFISLLVDEKVDKSQENYGIKHLPNLETKFVPANSLIGLEKEEFIRSPKVVELENELKKTRDRYFSASYTKEKEKLRKKDEEIREQLDVLLKESGVPAQNTAKIVKWNPYNSNRFADWFNSEWMFGVKDGFDIVIANPPYIDSEGMVNLGLMELRKYISDNYSLTKGNWDIYIAFFEFGFKILNTKGVLTFITPDKWISKPFGDELRKHTVNNIYAILKAGRKIFKSAKIDAIVSFFRRNNCENLKIFTFKDNNIVFKRKANKKVLKPPFAFDFLFSNYLELLIKIETIPNKKSDSFNCENACSTSDAYKLELLIKDLKKNSFDRDNQLKVINTGTIGKYASKWGIREMTYLGSKYLYPSVNKREFLKLFKNSYAEKSVQPKIIMKGLNLLDACLDFDGSIIPGKTTLIIVNNDINDLKYLLSILNSKLVFFYIKEKYSASSYNEGTNFTTDMINNLPVPKTLKTEQKPFIDLVDKILAITKDDDYLTNFTKQSKVNEYQDQIDKLVYKLYGLTPDEIKIVEGFNKQT